MIDKTQDNMNSTSSMDNRILLHKTVTDVKFNEQMKWLTVHVETGQEKICLRALQDEYKDYNFSFIVGKNTLYIGVCNNQAFGYNHMNLYSELKDLLVSPDRKQPSNIKDIVVANKLKKYIVELANRAYADIICMESEFIEGFYWLSRAFRDASALLKGKEIRFFNLEELLFISDDYDNLVNLLAQKAVFLTAICVNETDDRLDSIYPTGPAIITPKIAGDIAKSEAIGKGAAYYHPTPGYDDFLAYCSWRFHEPIPVEDIHSITAIFKRLSDLGLPTSKYFLELRDLGHDSIFTVFSPDYEEWCETVWY